MFEITLSSNFFLKPTKKIAQESWPSPFTKGTKNKYVTHIKNINFHSQQKKNRKFSELHTLKFFYRQRYNLKSPADTYIRTSEVICTLHSSVAYKQQRARFANVIWLVPTTGQSTVARNDNCFTENEITSLFLAWTNGGRLRMVFICGNEYADCSECNEKIGMLMDRM